MDREFRAKRKKCNGTIGEWVEGSLLKVGDRYYICSEPYQCAKYHSSLSGEEFGFGGFVLIDENTICRYTGLTDKNGNKIWEHDIFKHYNRVNFEDFESHTIGLIEWDEIHCRYTNKKWKNNEIYLLNSECVYEVIGNKFDNPELLEVLS